MQTQQQSPIRPLWRCRCCRLPETLRRIVLGRLTTRCSIGHFFSAHRSQSRCAGGEFWSSNSPSCLEIERRHRTAFLLGFPRVGHLAATVEVTNRQWSRSKQKFGLWFNQRGIKQTA